MRVWGGPLVTNTSEASANVLPTQDHVHDWSCLYSESELKKITNYNPALNAILKLSNPSMFKKGEADNDYVKIISKYTIPQQMLDSTHITKKRNICCDFT